MIRMDATYAHPETGETLHAVFRSNNSGAYLFTGHANRQISHDTGFRDPARMKRAIRAHLRHVYGCDRGNPELGRIRYS